MLSFSAVSVSRPSRVSAARSASVHDGCRANTRASSETASGKNPASLTTSATPGWIGRGAGREPGEHLVRLVRGQGVKQHRRDKAGQVAQVPTARHQD
jgi:hypothetical protein